MQVASLVYISREREIVKLSVYDEKQSPLPLSPPILILARLRTYLQRVSLFFSHLITFYPIDFPKLHRLFMFFLTYPDYFDDQAYDHVEMTCTR